MDRFRHFVSGLFSGCFPFLIGIVALFCGLVFIVYDYYRYDYQPDAGAEMYFQESYLITDPIINCFQVGNDSFFLVDISDPDFFEEIKNASREIDNNELYYIHPRMEISVPDSDPRYQPFTYRDYDYIYRHDTISAFCIIQKSRNIPIEDEDIHYIIPTRVFLKNSSENKSLLPSRFKKFPYLYYYSSMYGTKLKYGVLMFRKEDNRE